MKTSEFVKVAQKITATGLFYNLNKGERGKDMLGFRYFGSTKEHYETIWRKYGTLANMVITENADKVNEILKNHSISEFVAKPTKSGRFCRLETILE